jgi:hypothetical protein
MDTQLSLTHQKQRITKRITLVYQNNVELSV